VGGNVSSSSGLKLSLKDIVTEELTDGLPDLSIVIDSETLCRLLEDAEDSYEQDKRMEEGLGLENNDSIQIDAYMSD